jgi:hypothetical protein
MRFQYSPATILKSRLRTTEQRFWDFVQKGDAPGDCWLWTGCVYADGYARFLGTDWTLNKLAESRRVFVATSLWAAPSCGLQRRG